MKSHAIRLSTDVLNKLAKHAEPFTDSPNDVLRRLLKLDKPRKVNSGLHTASKAIRVDEQVFAKIRGKTASSSVMRLL